MNIKGGGHMKWPHLLAIADFKAERKLDYAEMQTLLGCSLSWTYRLVKRGNVHRRLRKVPVKALDLYEYNMVKANLAARSFKV